MLRVHCVQVFYNPGAPGMDDLLCEPESVRRFVGLRLTDPLPGGSTIPHLRHLLEQHGMGQRLLGGFTTICKTGMLRLAGGDGRRSTDPASCEAKPV